MQATMAPALTLDAQFKKGLSGGAEQLFISSVQGQVQLTLEIWGP